MPKIILACKNCKVLTIEKECPRCKSKNLTKNWKGFIYIINPEKSEVSKILNLSAKGKYAAVVI